jgi:two-component system, repressor protein LuxO
VKSLFRRLPWPGNVRQLLNVIRNVVVLNRGGPVTLAMLPDDLVREAEPAPPAAAFPDNGDADPFAGLSLAEIERRAVEAALARHAGSIPRAARELDVSPSTIYRKLEAWAARTS